MTASRPRQKNSQTSQNSQRVMVVRTLMDGRVTREIMPALDAQLQRYSAQNGVTVRSLRIEFGRVLDTMGVSV